MFQDGVSLGQTGGATTFQVTGLTASTGYGFTVRAIDGVGRPSGQSVALNVTTAVGGDTEPPSVPANLQASNIGETSLDLSWDASTDNVGVTDYEVFQDGVSLGQTGGATTFQVTGLTASTGYGFTVRAIDGVGNPSGQSVALNVTTAGNAIVDYTELNANLSSVDWTGRDLFADRNVGIGTTNTQGYRLAVAGSIIAEELTIELQTDWPDYVFFENYALPSLDEVERHIREKGYLINIPSASEVREGIQVGQINAKLLEKIEELTLYTIAQEKRIRSLESELKILQDLQKQIKNLESKLNER